MYSTQSTAGLQGSNSSPCLRTKCSMHDRHSYRLKWRDSCLNANRLYCRSYTNPTSGLVSSSVAATWTLRPHAACFSRSSCLALMRTTARTIPLAIRRGGGADVTRRRRWNAQARQADKALHLSDMTLAAVPATLISKRNPYLVVVVVET